MLIVTAVLPLCVRKVEENIEIFLCIMGILTAIIAGAFTLPHIAAIFQNELLYIITIAVVVFSIVFGLIEYKVGKFFDFLLKHLPLKVIVFLLIVCLGLLSSVITAVIASLLLIEFISLLPMEQHSKIKICIISCFSIGLGAALTPIGEPLSTIVVSKLDENFSFMANLLGLYIIGGILLLGLFGTFFAHNNWREKYKDNMHLLIIPEKETGKLIILRGLKIFVFIIGLEFLGFGFEPLIDKYVIHWSNELLYVSNTLSAVLDNATIAAAEISPAMSLFQIKVILVSLLVSGGMLVTGNIPNIICASKLRISMKEWAKFGLPIGFVMLLGYYVLLFILKV